MWFKDRWYCAWNGNDKAVKGTTGLQIYMSTSVDGKTWSPAFAPFSDPAMTDGAYRLTTTTQWQPEFIQRDGRQPT